MNFINTREYFVLFPGAQWDWKRWPLENFASIANRLYQETGWGCLVCGGVDDIKAIGSLTGHMKMVPIFSAVGHTNLCELLYLISRARLLVTNDTSAVHLGAIAATPCVAILGGGQYGRFLPYGFSISERSTAPFAAFTQMDCYGCDWFCKFDVRKGEPVPCILAVTVEQVWTKICEALGSSLSHREK
jgi:ADP-heptose:LPS heptosyltransferase